MREIQAQPLAGRLREERIDGADDGHAGVGALPERAGPPQLLVMVAVQMLLDGLRTFLGR